MESSEFHSGCNIDSIIGSKGSGSGDFEVPVICSRWQINEFCTFTIIELNDNISTRIGYSYTTGYHWKCFLAINKSLTYSVRAQEVSWNLGDCVMVSLWESSSILCDSHTTRLSKDSLRSSKCCGYCCCILSLFCILMIIFVSEIHHHVIAGLVNLPLHESSSWDDVSFSE